MRLLKYRVENFRSVKDSGWIDTGDVTALIGTNESGKTNLLLPLWKLNPAGEDGEIDLMADAPRSSFHQIRSDVEKPDFITAQFTLSDKEAAEVARISKRPIESVRIVEVTRNLDAVEPLKVGFPSDIPVREAAVTDIKPLFDSAKADISAPSALKGDEALQGEVLAAIDKAIATIDDDSPITVAKLTALTSIIRGVSLEGAPKTSMVVPRYTRLIEEISAQKTRISAPGATDVEAARQYVADNLPKFVYYSNYGNLDSEIYLPHVIANMQRNDLGARESAKARTLKVLFDFVRLKPADILELGQDFAGARGVAPTADQIAEIARNKREREILMTSASTELTNKFRDWWKQGDYRFRFDADGDHFRIWASDDKRRDEIELESRSTGLQWFLSFYLIFLVESKDEHAGTILLLDEPGLSLHPLAQRDLSDFFESLAKTNQLLYTTHSPFLVDPDHLDRVKAVFVKDDGSTGVSTDLRAGEREHQQNKSIYPVHAALGLSVSDALLLGSDTVIVEGPSDQLYLSAMKVLLIGGGRLTPVREIVFVPAAGTRGIKAVAGILAGKDGEMPRVLVDADPSGLKVATDLRNSWYVDKKGRVLDISPWATVPNAEIEDLIPSDIMSQVASRMLRGSGIDEEFSDVYKSTENVVDQIEAFAKKHGISLNEGWKVDLAKQIKARLLKQGFGAIEGNVLDRWTSLFQAILE